MTAQRVFRSALLSGLVAVAGAALGGDLTSQQQLGKSIFFDDNLAINNNQACAACHGPAAGWTGPDSTINAGGAAYEGSINGRFGGRKPPSSAYATPSPILHFQMDDDDELFVGGNFWDGRATGERLGSPAAEQAQGPFLNPLEQALPDSACVVYRVCTASYPVSFESVYPDSCPAFPADTDALCAEGSTVPLSPADRAKSNEAYDSIAFAIAAFEGSPESNAYTSKFDAYQAGKVALTQQEKLGLNMFNGKGKCAACHVLGQGRGKKDGVPLLTDFTFDNLGVPRNLENPFYLQTEFNPTGYAWVDMGLGGFLVTSPDVVYE